MHVSGQKLQFTHLRSDVIKQLRMQRIALPARSQRRQVPSHFVRARSTTAATAQIAVFGGGKLAKAQQTVLDAVSSSRGRGKSGVSPEQQAAFDAAVAVLEAAGGVRAPAASPLLEGRWRLLYTTRPGSASPIQRAFTGVDGFSVFQVRNSPSAPPVLILSRCILLQRRR